jgi:hypothetical protein
MTTNPNYRSYLLRLWRDQPDAPWRAALQSTVTGERINFAEIPQMFGFLLATLETPSAVAPPVVSAPSQDEYAP